MLAQIVISFGGGTASGPEVSIAVGGAAFVSTLTGFTVSTQAGLASIRLRPDRCSLIGSQNSPYGGAVSAAIGWNSGTPTVTLTGIDSPPDRPTTVTWPTRTGSVTQSLPPGQAVPLTGIKGGLAGSQ